MGKKKQAQRTKNNVVPASSGRSAELLQSTSSIPFAGFSTLKEGGYIPILSGISDELDVNINEDFRFVWKKMNKKDTTTKLKALDEFKKLCQETDVEALKPVLPYWPRLFSSLATDEEHRVREATHTAHRALVVKAGRNIAPFLKQLVGPWFTGQHDTYAPAASAAEAAFQEAFPPNKLIEAIIFCQEEILNYICNNLLNQTAQSLTNNQNCNQDVREAKYQRVVVSCLNGYALYLQRLPVEHLKKAEDANRKLVSSNKFWKFNKDSAPIVRASWFSALVALCEKAPFLLTDEAKHVCMAVFSNLDETDSTVVHSIWQAVLLTFSVVEDVWEHVSLEKLVLPKLWKVLREGADGSASLVFPNILPLLSKIPVSLVHDSSAFYAKFFENLRSGLKVRNVQISSIETNAVVTAFLECLRYLISTNCSDDKQCLSLLEEQLLPLMEAVISDAKLHLARPCLFFGWANLVNHWSKQPSSPLYTSLIRTSWNQLSALCQCVLKNHVTDAATLSTNCNALEILLTALKKPDAQPKKSTKVKFISPRKSKDDEIEDSFFPNEEQSTIAPSFEEERNKFVNQHLSVCLNLLKTCGDRAKVVLIGHLARTVEEYNSAEVFHHILSFRQMTFPQFYRQELAHWLRDELIPLDYSLRVIFTLIQYVEDQNDVQMVHADLSGEEIMAVTSKEGEPHLEPLYVRWQEILEWALQAEREKNCVQAWVVSHGGVCRLAAFLCRHDSSYNILHNCLRNLRHKSWLTTDTLRKLIHSLSSNLMNSSVSPDVKTCSADLLYAMLQNGANHTCLAQLPGEDLQQLLYQLLTASLQRLPHWPPGWQQCLAVIRLKSDADLTFSAVCEKCVDLLVAVVRTRTMDLSESEQLVTVLEDLVAVAGEEGCPALVALVLNRLSAQIRVDAEAVWTLYGLAGTVNGSLGHNFVVPCHFKSSSPKDPLANVPLQQYVTNMIPFLMMVVKLQTMMETEDSDRLQYARLRSQLPAEELWDWSLQVLELQSICVCLKTDFANTKQYFISKEKITFILEECGLFSQLRVKDLIKHMDLSQLEEGASSLVQNECLFRLQKQAVVKDLGLLYNTHQIQKDLLSFKSKSSILRCNFYPDEVLEELGEGESLEREKLTAINTCCRRLADLRATSGLDRTTEDTHITILDRVFDLYVSEEKENRSLLDLPDKELNFIAELADFACHSVKFDSAHMKQSSWDSCLVATAALTLSVSSTLDKWRGKAPPSPPAPSEPPAVTSASTQPWPLSLLAERQSLRQDQEEIFLRLPLVRVVCAVCRLFDTVSAHMSISNPEDKAAETRRTEWMDVFLPGSHAAIAHAWVSVTNLPCDQPAMLLMLEALSFSVAQFVEYPHFVEKNDTLGSLEICCRLLQSSEFSVQLAAYRLLIRLIPAMIELDMKECEKDNVALSCQLVDKSLIYTQSIINAILSGLSFGDTCIVEPFTDSYTYTRCYLLLWCALLELCANACSQLRALYTTWLKEEYLPVFLKTVFCLMPEAALHGDLPSQRTSQLFAKPPQLDKGVWGSERLAQLSCWVFACSLRHLPAAIRQWWNETDHRVYTLVEHVTATYVSPDLCAEEMKAIQTQEKKFDNMTVHVHPTVKEVYAVYTVEESRMELAIELAHNHPLGLVKVRSGQRMVSTSQTRQWLLQITIFLTHQNGSIWDALELWKTSLDKRFEGVEECYICFAILHSVSHQLPKLSCQTCRKKFHSHCLYKWFTTSNKSTCPICRNLF